MALETGSPISRRKKARTGDIYSYYDFIHLTYRTPEECAENANIVDVSIPGDYTLLDPTFSASNFLLPPVAPLADSENVPITSLSLPQLPIPAAYLSSIQLEAHTNRLALQKQQDKGKGTDDAYPRHVKNYVRFWEADQDRRAKENPNFVRTPAHPIIGEKVSLFLQNEITRNKVCPSQIKSCSCFI
ncbi:hypothetical protein BDZ97DRAFT_1671824 [Flammula alnicola]|nr:hypothetical protein BDZ97DRAFT_1671824 [Flammula alnicola]